MRRRSPRLSRGRNRGFAAACAVALASLVGRSALAQPWTNSALPPAQRAALLLSAMSEADKLVMVHGNGSPNYVGGVDGNTPLGIPALDLQDGPAGVGDGVTQVTAFPAPITLAASWDTSLAAQFGQALGVEQAGKGVNVVLAPMMNIDRVPQAGRNFEGFGEDPLLTGSMAAAVIQGIQKQGLVATAKHFIDNDQETNRNSINAVIDDRTQHEIYLPPFKASVEAGVGAVMCSYNVVNGSYACENGSTLLGWLKGELGFQGFVMSDWFAVHDSAPSAIGGLDMEMPSDGYFGATLAGEVDAGTVPQSRLDDMVTRILTSMFEAGLFDRPPSGSLDANEATPADATFARTVAAQGVVLLKNTPGLLPLDMSTVTSIAVIGDAGNAAPVAQGGGSSNVQAPFVTTPLQGIVARAGAGITVQSAPNDVTAATALASRSDVAIVVVGVTSAEGTDRATLSLPDGDDALVAAVITANPRTVVVVYSPAQVLMPWAPTAPAILLGWLPGQEEGTALASVLFGDTNPSGKLPMTFAVNAGDYPASSAAQFPGVDGDVTYSEGALVGYREFDTRAVTPLFPFGHGLSYTTFDYATLSVSPSTVDATSDVTGDVTVTFDVANSGSVVGAEVAQLYVGLPAEASEPPSQLKAFVKTTLEPSASSPVMFTLHPDDYSFWSAGLAKWVAYPGAHQIMIGSSSRDIRLRGAFTVQGGPLAGVTVQAETAVLEGGAAVALSQTGYTGSGYVTSLSSPGAKCTFAVNALAAGSYSLTARYSATTAPGSLSVYVNGAKVGQTTFPWLANLDTWDFVQQSITLSSGANTVTYEVDAGDTGGVNLDALIFGGAGVTSDAGAAPPVSNASPAPSSSSGCGCDVVGLGRRAPWATALLLIGLGLRRRRRLDAALTPRARLRSECPAPDTSRRRPSPRPRSS